MADLTSKVIRFNNKKTSIRLATAEWEALDIICKRENILRNHLLELLNTNKSKDIGLTSSVRLFSIIYFHQLMIEKEKSSYLPGKLRPSAPIFEAIKGIL